MRNEFLWIPVLGLLAVSLTGCPPKKQVIEEPPIDETQNPEDVQEPSLRGKEYQEVSQLVPVYFDTDQSTLRSDARASLQKNAQVLKENAEWEALVEGHCDDRGSTEYNLGLGQRRAAAVRAYYMSLGISGKRVATLSYGEEKPVCMESNESCWSQNRRGQTKVRINPGTSN